MAYIRLPLVVDPEQLEQDALDQIAATFPGWTPSDAHLEVALVVELARMIGEALGVALDVPDAIYTDLLTKLVGVPKITGTPATMTVTITAINNAGYTVPEGTTFAYRTTAGEYWVFRTTADAVIPGGSTQALLVPCESVDVGEYLNGIASGTVFVLLEGLSYVLSIVSTSITTGGVDAETDAQHRDRGREEFTLIGPRPILPPDFGIMARRTAGVHRAVVIDGYNPGDLTYNNERMVTVAAVDESGAAISAPVKTALQTDLDERREINFVVNVIDPTFTTLTIVFAAVAEPDADPADVELAAEAAVADFIAPGAWGGGDQSPPTWDLDTVVRYQDLVTVLNNVPGLSHYTSLTLNGGTADVVLTGAAPLPRKIEGGGSSVAGTVVGS